MSDPYVFTPDAAYMPGPYGSVPLSAHYSPFAPDVSVLPPSPYSRPGSIQGSPNFGVNALPPTSLAFPTMEEPYFRQRRPSWHGPAPVIGAPGLFPPQGHVRSNSFGHASAAGLFSPPASAPLYNVNWNGTYTPWTQPAVNPVERYIHPWLNGEAPRKDFFFNMALPTFTPMRMMANGGTVILGTEELAQPATHPAIFELKIICDRIPQWPILLEYQPLLHSSNPYYAPHPSAGLGVSAAAGGAPPIAVGDVLQTIHTELHKMITHSDYRELSTKEQDVVKKAYAKRCASAGPAAQQYLLSQGIKRVDFLGSKCWFKGLIRTGESLNELKLVTGSSS